MQEDIFFWFDFEEIEQSPKLNKDIIKEQIGANKLNFLGNGAFGEAWLCRFDEIDYVFKIIYNTSFSMGRINREVEGLERIDNKHTVKFYEHGYINYNDKSLPYLKFEYIDGGNILNHIKNDNWPNYSKVFSLLKGLLEGVVHLNEAKIIHRDLKPENIILRNGRYDKPVIVDLGLIKIVDTSDYTIYPRIMGTKPFMAPEQIRGEKPKKSTDLWAIGIIIYILTTRKHPFYGGYEKRLDIESALDRLLSGPPPLPKDTPEPIRSMVMRFLSPEPYQRGSAKRALKDIERGA